MVLILFRGMKNNQDKEYDQGFYKSCFHRSNLNPVLIIKHIVRLIKMSN